MIYKEKINQPVTREVYFAPCFKCGSEDINVWDCGYSAFNVYGATCKKCKQEIQCKYGDFEAKVIAEKWNNVNSPVLIIEQAKAKIRELEKLIDSARERLRDSAEAQQ